jgi:hypothetical protein
MFNYTTNSRVSEISESPSRSVAVYRSHLSLSCVPRGLQDVIQAVHNVYGLVQMSILKFRVLVHSCRAILLSHFVKPF